jgi:hypothetical protein
LFHGTHIDPGKPYTISRHQAIDIIKGRVDGKSAIKKVTVAADHVQADNEEQSSDCDKNPKLHIAKIDLAHIL